MMSRRHVFAVLLNLVMVTAVAAASKNASTPDPQLEQRIHTYMDALKSYDIYTLYGLESGSIDGTLSANSFRLRMESMPARVVACEIVNVSRDGDSALAELDVSFRYPQFGEPITTTRRVKWQLVKGQWYLNNDAALLNSIAPATPR